MKGYAEGEQAREVWEKWVREVRFGEVEYVPDGFMADRVCLQEECLCLSALFFDQNYPILSGRMSEGLWVCEMLILMNGQNDTAWNVKKGYLQTQKVDLMRQLQFSQAICLKNKKSSSYYDYRLTIWQNILADPNKINKEDWQKEVKFLERVLERHRRNYFAWMYRNKLYKLWLSKLGPQVRGWEVGMLHGWLGRNPNDYSAYSWLISVAKGLNKEQIQGEIEWCRQLNEYCELAYESPQSYRHIETYKKWLLGQLEGIPAA